MCVTSNQHKQLSNSSSDIGLVKNNALVGAQIAVSLSEITRSKVEKTSARHDSHVKYYPSSEQVEEKSNMQPPSVSKFEIR